MMRNNYITIAGNIGAGKTSLVEFLCRRYQVKPFFEPNDTNPYLEDFYKDMHRWAFHSQVYFLTHKFRLHQRLSVASGTVIQDRSIYEDAEIFARNLYNERKISKQDYTTYCELYANIIQIIRPPDLLIYLKCDLRTIKKRIASRGRPMEKDIPDAYLRKLNRLYNGWVDRYDLSPKLTIVTDKLDYQTDLCDQIYLLKRIEKHILL